VNLRIDTSPQSEEELMELSNLRGLRSLALEYAENLTDKGVEHLFGEGTFITEVYLVGCPNVTDAVLPKLAQTLKVCTIKTLYFVGSNISYFGKRRRYILQEETHR